MCEESHPTAVGVPNLQLKSLESLESPNQEEDEDQYQLMQNMRDRHPIPARYSSDPEKKRVARE